MVKTDVKFSTKSGVGSVVTNAIRSIAMAGNSVQPIAIFHPTINTLNVGDSFADSTTQVINNIFGVDFTDLNFENCIAKAEIDGENYYLFGFAGSLKIEHNNQLIASLFSESSICILFRDSFGVKTTDSNRIASEKFKERVGTADNFVAFSSRHCPIEAFRFSVEENFELREDEVSMYAECSTDYLGSLLKDFSQIKLIKILS